MGSKELPSIPMVNGLDCPACGHPTLILGDGGYITCSLEGCPNPDYAESSAAWHTAEVERARLEARLHFIEQLRGNAEINPDPDTSNGWIGDSLLDWLDSEAERLQPQPQKGQV